MTIRPIAGIIAANLVLIVSAFGALDARQRSEPPMTYPQVAVDSAAEVQATLAYWTPERMASATPMEMPTRFVENLPPQQNQQVLVGNPGFVNGWQPGSGPYVEQVQTFPRSSLPTQGLLQAFAAPPTNPLSGPYGPFSRYAMQGNYIGFPRSFIGKLFFSQNGGSFVCSASVIGRSTLATAGHCVSDGAGTFSTNFMFCPSFNNVTGVNPARGCWAWSQATTSAGWHFSGNLDHDYACIVTPTTGTVHASRIGDITGWAGRAWGWADVPTTTFGYPAGAPFPGNIIHETNSVEWYNVDWVAGGQVSKAIGSDLTGGSSGGPWYMSWRHPNAEAPDTDNSSGTDPISPAALTGPHINGVNSAKRCFTNCNTPPTAVTGLFWQEMVSPPFLNSVANDESEDIFAPCLAHSNNTSAPASAHTAALAKVQAAAARGQK
jgi:V8-like Glu-specific endopeptidase